MTTTRGRTEMQKELTEYFGEDIMQWLTRERELYGRTWRSLSDGIYNSTGYRVKHTTLARWMSYERNGR